MGKKRKKPLQRGPKDGKKHTPGRDHNRKSRGAAKKRFAKKARLRREARRKEAERQWQLWDSMTEEERKLREELFPKLPRPSDESSD
jgi:hypothetical protein